MVDDCSNQHFNKPASDSIAFSLKPHVIEVILDKFTTGDLLFGVFENQRVYAATCDFSLRQILPVQDLLLYALFRNLAPRSDVEMSKL